MCGFERRQVRTADMMAISTWPSRGLYAVGIEIKVNSSDLAKELASPSKADDIANIAVFLLSDAGKWVTGACWTADGGYSCR